MTQNPKYFRSKVGEFFGYHVVISYYQSGKGWVYDEEVLHIYQNVYNFFTFTFW